MLHASCSAMVSKVSTHITATYRASFCDHKTRMLVNYYKQNKMHFFLCYMTYDMVLPTGDAYRGSQRRRRFDNHRTKRAQQRANLLPFLHAQHGDDRTIIGKRAPAGHPSDYQKSGIMVHEADWSGSGLGTVPVITDKPMILPGSKCAAYSCIMHPDTFNAEHDKLYFAAPQDVPDFYRMQNTRIGEVCAATPINETCVSNLRTRPREAVFRSANTSGVAIPPAMQLSKSILDFNAVESAAAAQRDESKRSPRTTVATWTRSVNLGPRDGIREVTYELETTLSPEALEYLATDAPNTLNEAFGTGRIGTHGNSARRSVCTDDRPTFSKPHQWTIHEASEEEMALRRRRRADGLNMRTRRDIVNVVQDENTLSVSASVTSPLKEPMRLAFPHSCASTVPRYKRGEVVSTKSVDNKRLCGDNKDSFITTLVDGHPRCFDGRTGSISSVLDLSSNHDDKDGESRESSSTGDTMKANPLRWSDSVGLTRTTPLETNTSRYSAHHRLPRHNHVALLTHGDLDEMLLHRGSSIKGCAVAAASFQADDQSSPGAIRSACERVESLDTSYTCVYDEATNQCVEAPPKTTTRYGGKTGHLNSRSKHSVSRASKERLQSGSKTCFGGGVPVSMHKNTGSPAMACCAGVQTKNSHLVCRDNDTAAELLGTCTYDGIQAAAVAAHLSDNPEARQRAWIENGAQCVRGGYNLGYQSVARGASLAGMPVEPLTPEEASIQPLMPLTDGTCAIHDPRLVSYPMDNDLVSVYDGGEPVESLKPSRKKGRCTATVGGVEEVPLFEHCGSGDVMATVSVQGHPLGTASHRSDRCALQSAANMVATELLAPLQARVRMGTDGSTAHIQDAATGATICTLQGNSTPVKCDHYPDISVRIGAA